MRLALMRLVLGFQRGAFIFLPELHQLCCAKPIDLCVCSDRAPPGTQTSGIKAAPELAGTLAFCVSSQTQRLSGDVRSAIRESDYSRSNSPAIISLRTSVVPAPISSSLVERNSRLISDSQM